jgi:hypothetical protein
MVEPFDMTAAWMWQISPPLPREPLWKGLDKGGLQGFVKFNHAAKQNYFFNNRFILVLLFN